MYIKLSFRKFLKEYLNSVIPLGECVFEADTHNPIILIHFHFSSSQVPNGFQSLVPESRKRFQQKISIEAERILNAVGKKKEKEQWFPLLMDVSYVIFSFITCTKLTGAKEQFIIITVFLFSPLANCKLLKGKNSISLRI